MRNKNYKGKVVKYKSPKCDEVVRCYDKVMLAYAKSLDDDRGIKEYRTNIPVSDELTTDFLITRTDGTFYVRECVIRSVLTCKVRNKITERLDYSRCYWRDVKHIEDWGLVVDAKE